MPFYSVTSHLLHDGGEFGPANLFPGAADIVEMDETTAATLQGTGILGLEVPAPAETNSAKDPADGDPSKKK